MLPPTMGQSFDLDRFLSAQAHNYGTALAELQAGEKRSHWMWYVFPQLRGLGRSDNANYFGIASLDEARAYLADPVLGGRLRECVVALLNLGGSDAGQVLGNVDAQKLRSSITLFRLACPDEPVFAHALNRYFEGRLDPRTVSLLEHPPGD
jgi:uncharacterized protein (DUF1810 family)